jgi:iron complex outermembrane receptor protein
MIGRGLLLSTMLLPVSAWAQTTEEPQSGQQSTVEEIIVTAQKREQNLQAVPVSITALSEKTLEMVRFANVKDLNAVAPGLTVRESAGGSQIPVFTLRGVYGSTTYASDAGVALYIDGVYINGTAGAQFDVADIERIEVLRGPQGTLFGRNAIGGAVNLITREPSGQFGAKEELSYGNLGQFRSKTRVDLPTWGPLSASITYLHNERDGDVRNLGAGTTWDYGPATNGAYGVRTSPKRLGDQNVEAVSGAVMLEPGADIKVIYRFDWSHNKYTPDAVGVLKTSAFVDPIIAAQADPSLFAARPTERPDAVNNNFTTNANLRTEMHNVTMTVPVADTVTVKNIAAWRKVRLDTSNQLDGLGGLSFGPDTPFVVLVNGTTSRQHTFSDELQVNVNTDWFDFTAGILHFNSVTAEGGFPNATNSPVFTAMPGFVIPTTGAQLSRVKVRSDAIYMQNELHLTDKLDLVAGTRLTRDIKSGIDNSPTPALPGVEIAYRKSTPTWLAGVNYQLTDNIFTYAKYSTAYISGGQLAGIQFSPTTARSWEAGIKADLLDKRARVNIALFTVKYRNVQNLVSPQNLACVALGVSPAASQCIINGGDGRAKGFEVESSLVPIEGLTLQGNLSYTDYKYTRIDPALRNPVDGSFVPEYRPKWIGTASAQYNSEEIVAGGHLVARLDANYSSSAYGTPNSTRQDLEFAKIPAAWIVNGRLGLADIDVGGMKADIALFGKNIFDNKSITYSVDLVLDIAASYQRARTYGLDASISF